MRADPSHPRKLDPNVPLDTPHRVAKAIIRPSFRLDVSPCRTTGSTILLRILAERRADAETPTPGDILKAAQEAEPNVFRQWSPKGVSNALRRYGIQTATLHGRRVYSKVSLADLGQIQTRYGLSLGLQTDDDEAHGQDGVNNVHPRTPTYTQGRFSPCF